MSMGFLSRFSHAPGTREHIIKHTGAAPPFPLRLIIFAENRENYGNKNKQPPEFPPEVDPHHHERDLYDKC